MTDKLKTASDVIVTAPPVAPPSPPTDLSDERLLPVGGPEVVDSRILSEKPRVAPPPVKI